MATSWIALVGNDIAKVIDITSMTDANQNTVAGTEPGAALDIAQANRRDDAINMAVRTVRGAIQGAGRHPISVTTGCVPPGEAERHTSVIAAWWLINSTPGLTRSFLAGDGQETPFGRLYKEACAWLDKLKSGETFPLPTDPTGVDYLTAANSTTNLLPNGISWGDQDGTDVEHEAGQSTDSFGVEHLLPVNMTT